MIVQHADRLLLQTENKMFAGLNGALLHPTRAQLPGEYTPAYTFQGATDNLSTNAISVYRQVLIYG